MDSNAVIPPKAAGDPVIPHDYPWIEGEWGVALTHTLIRRYGPPPLMSAERRP
jgi:hypothetical protein